MNSILQVIITVLGGGLGAFGATEVVKFVKSIPINDGQKARLRATAAFFSVVATLLVSTADGTLEAQSLQDGAVMLVSALGAWATSHGVHKATK